MVAERGIVGIKWHDLNQMWPGDERTGQGKFGRLLTGMSSAEVSNT